MEFIMLIMLAAFAALVGFIAMQAMQRPFKEELEEQRVLDKVREERKEITYRNNSDAEEKLLVRAAFLVEKLLPIARQNELNIREKLDVAGLKFTAAAWRGIVVTVTFLAGLAAVLAAALLGANLLAVVGAGMVGASAGYIGCQLYVRSKAKKRSEEISKKLPDALERLASVVGAGLPLDEAFKEVSNAKELFPITEEFARVDREINFINSTYEEALLAMSKRCNSAGVTYFVSAMIQCIREGTSILGTLQSQADMARSGWFDNIREQINKIDTKISIPLGLCFMPGAVLIIIVPTIVDAFNSMSSMF